MAAALRITELLAERIVRIHLPPAESPQTFGSCSRRAANSFHPRIPDAASGSVAGGLRHRSRSGGRLVERAVHLLERAALGFGAERPMRNKTGQDGGSFPGLLNRYTAKTRIVGSNPIPSATSP